MRAITTQKELFSTRWRPLSDSEARCAEDVAAELLGRLDLVTDWRLQKAYFLAEVWSIEERLERLSKVDFASWKHGPWSLHIRQAEEALEDLGLLFRDCRPAKRRSEAEFLKLKAKPATGLDKGEKDFLDSVAEQLRYLDGDALTALAKDTAPYTSTDHHEIIDLYAYLKDLRRKHEKFDNSPRVAALVAEAEAKAH